MSNKINEIKRVLGAAARQSKYRILFTFPTSVKTKSDLRDINVMAKSASFPSITIGQVEIFNQGRKFILPGDTSFDTTWQVMFYNQENHQIRLDFLSWMLAIDSFQKNWHSGVPGELMVDMTVQQLDSAENVSAVYTFHNVWPQMVDNVDVSADAVDQVQEFGVTFSFTDWVVGTEELSQPNNVLSPTLNDVAQ
nr:MAG TPA: Baseplate wedge protein [Caudoviricetes sp.]